MVLESENERGREVDWTWSTNLSCLFTRHGVKIQTLWRQPGSQSEGEGAPGRPPDNGELSRLRRGVGDISQIRTDHKPLDAIQFCGPAIRGLIMCHPSIRPPPVAVSPAINPPVTSCALRQSPHPLPLSRLPPSAHVCVSSQRFAAAAAERE